MLDDDFFSEPTHKKEEQAFTKQLGWEGRLKAGDNLLTWVRLSKGRVAKGDDFDSAADVLMVKKIN